MSPWKNNFKITYADYDDTTRQIDLCVYTSTIEKNGKCVTGSTWENITNLRALR